RDRLRAVVLEDGEVGGEARAVERAVDGEGEDDRGEAHADGDAGLAGDVERGRGEDAAEQESGRSRARGELRHVAAIHVVEPPAVLLLAGPAANLRIVELLQRHEVRSVAVEVARAYRDLLESRPIMANDSPTHYD